jgi:hypothetical protein
MLLSVKTLLSTQVVAKVGEALFQITLGRAATQRAALMRVDMMAAVLRRHVGLTIREIIALLDKEFR